MKQHEFARSTVHESATTIDADSILVRLCQMLLDGQTRDRGFGMVAACVVDPQGHQVCALNRFVGNGKRMHAERAAIERYREHYGDLPDGCTVVTTLSPCNRPMDERYGESCTDLLAEHNITNVYCGYKDPTQDHDTSTETKNSKLKKLCKQFADTFLKTESLNESTVPELDKFIEFTKGQLQLDHVPPIKIVDTIPGAAGTTFGLFRPEDNTIYVVAKDRHPKDVFRTLGHELVHWKQRLEKRLKPDSGETGSPIENEANALAGVLMRKYNQMEPEPVQEARSLRQAAGKRAGEKITPNDILRLQGEITRLKKSHRSSERERGIRLERQLRTFKNTHQKKNHAVGAQDE